MFHCSILGSENIDAKEAVPLDALVRLPVDLCAKVPASVSADAAAFTVIGAIGLHGIRLVQPTIGEAAAVVTGLGLNTVQLLRAHGCRVLGIDLYRSKLDLARQFGAEVMDLSSGQDAVAAAETISRRRGCWMQHDLRELLGDV